MTESAEETRTVEAGEYVLGVMTAQERQAFEVRLNQEPALAEAVKTWTEHFANMSRNLEQVPVSPTVWARVNQSMQKTEAAGANRQSWFAPWFVKTWAIAASVVAVALAVPILNGGTAANNGPHYVAVLKSPDKSTEWLVEALPNDTVRVYQIGSLPIEGNPAAMGKSLQLWTKAPTDSAPTSLGLMELGKSMVLPASALPTLVDEQLFVVTLEPKMGSPYSNKPTGDVMFIGEAVALVR